MSVCECVHVRYFSVEMETKKKKDKRHFFFYSQSSLAWCISKRVRCAFSGDWWGCVAGWTSPHIAGIHTASPQSGHACALSDGTGVWSACHTLHMQKAWDQGGCACGVSWYPSGWTFCHRCCRGKVWSANGSFHVVSASPGLCSFYCRLYTWRDAFQS